MEAFSNAYLQAVAAVAGCSVAKPLPDMGKVDWTLGSFADPVHPRLDVQLKSTWNGAIEAQDVVYDLDIETYDLFRSAEALVPRILVVVVVPPELGDWLTQTEDELALRRCGYWLSLRGREATTNTASIRLRIPRRQRFSPEALQQMMKTIRDGDAP